jgi:hypothetical protein
MFLLDAEFRAVGLALMYPRKIIGLQGLCGLEVVVKEVPERVRYPLTLNGGTYQESCPLGVLELRTSIQLTSIGALGCS